MMCQRVTKHFMLDAILFYLNKTKQTKGLTSGDSTFQSRRQRELQGTSEQEADLGMADFQSIMVAAICHQN